MSRPPGMDALLRIIEYSRAQHLIWDAVEAAQDENCTVENFIREARKCWGELLERKAKYDDSDFVKALR